MNIEMIDTMTIIMSLFKELKKEQFGGDFTTEKNIIWGSRMNCREKCKKHFRTWLLLSKSILFKEGLLILM